MCMISTLEDSVRLFTSLEFQQGVHGFCAQAELQSTVLDLGSLS